MIDQADIRRLIDSALDARMGRQQIIGTVTGVPDTNRYVLVRIGDATQPVPVYRPALPSLPIEGDRVLLARGPEGLLVIDKVLDRDADVYVPPEDPDTHDLAEHEALGLVSEADLATHVSRGHLITWTSQNSLGTHDGEWSLMASGVIPVRFGSVAFEALIGGGGSNDDVWTRGRIRGRVRQQDDFGSDPFVTFELLDAGDITGDDFAVVILDNAGPTTFELYVCVTRVFEWVEWTPLWTSTDRCDFAWTGCQDFVSALP